MTIAHDSFSGLLPKSTTSERLIAAALAMFSSRGMAATTREIADEAGRLFADWGGMNHVRECFA